MPLCLLFSALSTGAIEDRSITCCDRSHVGQQVTLRHAVQHSSHLEGKNMENEALAAFSKALGKTMVNLHKNCLTLDWQNFKVIFTDIGEEVSNWVCHSIYTRTTRSHTSCLGYISQYLISMCNATLKIFSWRPSVLWTEIHGELLVNLHHSTSNKGAFPHVCGVQTQKQFCPKASCF